MLREIIIIGILVLGRCITGSSESLLKNGDFERTYVIAGPASVDVGFGVWELLGDRRAPSEWSMNSSYPGELRVLDEDPPSGTNFVRIRCANAHDSAHLFQPCPALRVGKWYKVSALVRGGYVAIGFYEYFDKGVIRVTNVVTMRPRAGKWEEVSGYYSPVGEGFQSASVAIQVPKGETVDVDNVQISEVPLAETPEGYEPVVIENALVRMRLSPRASLIEFTDKKTGQNYARPESPLPIMKAVQSGRESPARLLRQKGDAIEVFFVDPEVKVLLKIVSRNRHFTFEVIDVEPGNMERLEIAFPLKRQKILGWAFAANYGDEFAICSFALNFQTQSILLPSGDLVGVGARCLGTRGIKGAKAALIGCPFPQFNSVIQEVEREHGLPCPVLDGKWVRESEPVRRSYLFATEMSEKDTDALIKYAKVGNFQTILIHMDAFLRTHGHYEINKANFPDGLVSLKRVVGKIHKAGLKAGVHLFGPSISPNDPYVTPKPDERLLSVACPPLAEAIDEKATTITLSAQPEGLFPKKRRSYAFPGKCLRVGDEIITYGNVEVGPPFRYTDCTRGAHGTKAVAHPAGETVRGLLTLWGFFLMDPDSTLLDEVTTNFARIVNECKLDFVYFDASDSASDEYLDVAYYLDKCHTTYYKKFDHGVLYQVSTGTGSNLCWHIVARSASADGHGDIKGYLDERYDSILQMKDNFVYADVGWYGLNPGSRPDRLEYICAKCLGCDGSISVQATRRILESHPFARPILEMIGEYERCRIANYFPESVKAKLREKGKEFRLMPDRKGGWRLFRTIYEPERNISRFDGIENVWTINNDLAHPCRLVVDMSREVRLSAGSDYDHPGAVLLEDFNDTAEYVMSERNDYEKFVVGEDKIVTQDGPVRKGVTQRLTLSTTEARVGKTCGVLAATNAGEYGGWSGIGKRFLRPIDLSGMKAIALWVHGDGKMEILKLQLWDTAGYYHDCVVWVNFKGWQLHTFDIDPRSAFNWKQVEYLLLYYNALPEKTTVTCKIDGIKALPRLTMPGPLSNLELRVNGKRIPLPGEIRMGQSLTTDGFGTVTLWPGGMKPGKKTRVPETAVVLMPGSHKVEFLCKSRNNEPVDISVRLSRLWPLER